jgi:hypothetical protein
VILALSQNLLVDLDDFPRHYWSSKMLNVRTAIGPLAMSQGEVQPRDKFLHVRLTDMAVLSASDDFTNIPNIGGDNRQITRHRLFDNVGRSFLVRSEQECIASTHIKR